MVPLSKSVSDSAIQFPQIRFCAVPSEAKPTFVSGCATLCWEVLISLSPKCRQNKDLLKGLGDEMVGNRKGDNVQAGFSEGVGGASVKSIW